jgi:hypothetical protein
MTTLVLASTSAACTSCTGSQLEVLAAAAAAADVTIV